MHGSLRDEEVFVTEFRNLPEGWLAVLGLGFALAVLWAVVWMYRREGRIGASTRRRMILAILRCAVFVTLGIVFLEPVRVRILRRWIDSYTIVLVDKSSSMDLVDTYRDAGSADRVKSALEVDAVEPVKRSSVVDVLMRRDGRRFLRDLAQSNRVKLYAFSHEPELIGTIGVPADADTQRRDREGAETSLLSVDEVPTHFAATGRATNIERAVRRAVESLGNAPVAGVVVLSDGGFNEGAPAEDTAGYARDRTVPIHTVGVGDPTPPRNVRVTEILAPENVFKQDPFSISARLTSQGLEGRTIRVELHERGVTQGGIVDDNAAPDEPTGKSVVATRDAVVGRGGTIEPVTFQRRQERVGRFVYTVEVPVLDEESVADDNSRQTVVNVIDARTKVLIVSGQPSWEYRFVSRLLQRDESVDVSCWLQSADLSAVRDGNTVIDHMSRLPEELFTYDVIILMDPDRAAFDEPWCRLADTFATDHGGGLLFTAARTFAPAFLREPSLRPLHDLLPVTLDPDADLILNQIGHYQQTSSPVVIPETVYGHSILQLADDPVSTKLAWQGVGEVYWHYPVLREKPVATVLMRHGDSRMRNSYGGHVLAAVQFIGAGRTGFLGFDGTWRWRRHGEEVFNRLWVQFVRYLAEGKLLGAAKRGILLTDSDQFSLGDAVTVTARLFDERYEPLQRDEVEAQYTVEGQRTSFVLTSRQDRAGWYEGRFVPDRAGAYRITVRIPGLAAGEVGEGILAPAAAREIRVSRPNLEILRPQMDRAALTTLAEQSEGGRYFEVDQIHDLPELIPDLHEEISIRSRPTALWDNWKTLLVLLTLLAVEWFVRKWSRLL
ncbi:MAG: hypothetical protein ACYTFA_00100 [Planctomycetota bacterium]|jgi:hypothetical protein